MSESALRARVASRLVRMALRRVPVRVVETGGATVSDGPAGAPTIELHQPDQVWRRIGRHPKLGIGESYQAGEWSVAHGTDLADALTPFAARLASILPSPLLRLRAVVDQALPESRRNTRDGAQENIEAHYDLSNDLFAAFLDPSLSYSAALFDGPADASPAALREQDLQEAQHRKIDRILDEAGVGEGTTMLEIGSGWGELAIRAASRGADVVTITLSSEQQELAAKRIADAGLADRVDVRLQDYREVTGRFDAIVSVEMIEAVGEEYWPEYFAALDRLLAPAGTVVLQAILMEHERYLATRRSYGWIQKHIFPGGLIPSEQAIREISGAVGLEVTEVAPFGSHYAETLRRWRHTFNGEWPQICALGFDETFRRTWEFYLAYSEAGFASGYLDVAQLRLQHKGVR